MIELVIIVLVVWYLIDRVSKNEQEIDVKNMVQEKIKIVKRSENELEEINSMIEDTKTEIIKASREEKVEDIKFYLELLEILLKERKEIIKKVSQADKTVRVSRKVGRKIKGVVKGIKEGLKED